MRSNSLFFVWGIEQGMVRGGSPYYLGESKGQKPFEEERGSSDK